MNKTTTDKIAEAINEFEKYHYDDEGNLPMMVLHHSDFITFVNKIANILEEEDKNKIIELTCGYPLEEYWKRFSKFNKSQWLKIAKGEE